jgi:hypothetical protein
MKALHCDLKMLSCAHQHKGNEHVRRINASYGKLLDAMHPGYQRVQCEKINENTYRVNGKHIINKLSAINHSHMSWGNNEITFHDAIVL